MAVVTQAERTQFGGVSMVQSFNPSKRGVVAEPRVSSGLGTAGGGKMAITETRPADLDFSKMEGPELLEACGDNAANWAAAFCQVAKSHGHPLNQEWVMGWFANAIEHSNDVRTDNFPTMLPDGSAFFVA